jgi:hypothetical protein
VSFVTCSQFISVYILKQFKHSIVEIIRKYLFLMGYFHLNLVVMHISFNIIQSPNPLQTNTFSRKLLN